MRHENDCTGYNFPFIMKRMVQPTVLILVLSCLSFTARTQEVWSLQRCIEYARENNLTVKQAEASVRTAQLTESQAKASRLPGVSASFNAGEQFGRTIDPTTNSFSTQAVGYNSVGVDASMPLFNGGQIHHSVKRAAWNLRASEADAAQIANNLGLQIAQAYLTILLTEEQLESARGRVTQSNRQLDATLRLIDAGSLPRADRFTIDAQIAREEQSAIVVQNNLELAYLNLKQLLQLEPDYDLRVERPAFQLPADDASVAGLTLPPLYDQALTTQPSVQATAARIQAAEEGVAVARSAYWPSVFLFGSLNSNYSTAFQQPVIGPVEGVDQQVDVNGQPVTVTFYQPSVTYNNVPYFDQFNQNFGQGVGLNIRIPIYQNGSVRLNVEQAKLNVLNARLQDNQTHQQLKNDIQTAIANARAARLQLFAAQKTFDANRTAFENTEKRHTLGAVNTLELTTAKNNLDLAENDLIVARYDYLFKLKILDFYQGKPLTLN